MFYSVSCWNKPACRFITYQIKFYRIKDVTNVSRFNPKTGVGLIQWFNVAFFFHMATYLYFILFLIVAYCILLYFHYCKWWHMGNSFFFLLKLVISHSLEEVIRYSLSSIHIDPREHSWIIMERFLFNTNTLSFLLNLNSRTWHG